MKFRKQRLTLNDRRVKTWFAWWPIYLCHHHCEYRWLERVTVEQVVMGASLIGEPPHHSTFRWENDRFVDDIPKP